MFGIASKTAPRSAIALLGVGLLAGCASNPDRLTDKKAKQSPTYTDQYISYVERNARRNNVQVYWVNPPRRNPRKPSSKE